MTFKSVIYKSLAILTLSVMLSCNSTTKKETETITETTANESNTSTPLSAGTYTSKMTKPDKKKYYNSSNDVVYEVKYKPDGFKLRTASSQLLWKIKLYDDKVKISDNEENLNPYEIKIGDTYKAKLVRDGKELAKTSYDLESKVQSILAQGHSQPLFYEGSYSIAYLVDLIEDINADQREIIIDELKAKGY